MPETKQPALTRLVAIAAFLLAGCLGTGPAAPAAMPVAPDAPPRPFADPATLDPDVPTPESVIGHAVGARAVRYEPMVAYLRRLAEASPFMTLTTYGRTHEGRDLYYATITSADNHGRLDRIRADAAALADPRGVSDVEADAIVQRLPGIAWLAYAIHGDELSPCDAAVQVAYQLCAGTDAATRRLRDDLVIIIDPLQNPDGRERYLAQLQTLEGKVPNPDYQSMQHRGLWSAGRGNHYLFDLNRDWLMLAQPETRGRVAAILRWHPHFLVDSHEMSGLDTFMFDPPREPLNVDLSETVMQWRGRFSGDQARAFDAHGWSYYTHEWYEEWYPGYTNGWANLLGTIGLLYEAQSLNGSLLKQASGEIVTYRQPVHQNVVGSIANLETLRANRTAILRDFYDDRKWAVTTAGPSFVVRPDGNRSRLGQFVDLMTRHGIEHATVDGPMTATGVVNIRGERSDRLGLPAGTIVIPSQQPHRRLVHAFLGFDPRMSDEFLLEERTDLETGEGSRIYDTTAWNLSMAYDLDAYWADDVVEGGDAAADRAAPPPDDTGTYGYLLDGADSDVYTALARLYELGCHPRAASKPFAYRGRRYRPGAILLRRHENPANLDAAIVAATGESNVHVVPVASSLAGDGPDLGGQRFHLLHEPRIAIASQYPVSTTAFGATWHRLDARRRLRVSPVSMQGLGFIDLRKYNVLIIPNTAGPLGAVLGEGGMRRLADWVEDGGTLIAYGSAAAALAREDGLSAVRRRRDVLDELDVYAEEVARERAALAVEIDPDEVWRRGPRPEAADAPAGGDGNAGHERHDGEKSGGAAKPVSAATGDALARAREDQWRRTFSPQGVFVQASADPRHFLCYGVDGPLPVYVSGSTVLLSRRPAETPVRLADEDHLRLSGLLWPEARTRLADAAYATRESRGRGQIILFAGDPIMRGYLEGSGRLLENAIFLGPGMGTAQGVPW